MIFNTIDYIEGRIRIIDQTLLPSKEIDVDLCTVDEVAEAICSMKIRGAPAIGIVAAYGVLLSLENFLSESVVDPPPFFFDHGRKAVNIDTTVIEGDSIRKRLLGAIDLLAGTRPTAVDLFVSLKRMRSVIELGSSDAQEICDRVENEAFLIFEEELETEKVIGRNGSVLIRDGMKILTHCNAGGLATAGYGTALGVIYASVEQGKKIHVYADETRPLLQGARLTAWELVKKGIETTVLCDNAAASLLSSGNIDLVITGADRIAGNGDTANKIGTLSLAILCSEFNVPFYVAAPWTTFDPGLSCGEKIPVENRADTEVTFYQGYRTVPDGVGAYNPAFDVTPSRLISAFITEKGIIEKPFEEKIRKIAKKEI